MEGVGDGEVAFDIGGPAMLPEGCGHLVANVGHRPADESVRWRFRRSTVGAMSAPATEPRSASYGTTTIFAAGFGLLLLLAALGVLSAVVRDANAGALEDRVVPGKISVVGAAKVRTWSSRDFEVQIPSGWVNIATGPASLENAAQLEGLTASARRATEQAFERQAVAIHRWQGSLTDAATQTDCRPGTICAEIRVERSPGRKDLPISTFAKDKVGAFEQDERGISTIDLGPVTARGGRWVWRWSGKLGGERRTSYFFATCRGARVDQYFQVTLQAPASVDVQDQFADLLASISTKAPAQPRSDQGEASDCGDVVDG